MLALVCATLISTTAAQRPAARATGNERVDERVGEKAGEAALTKAGAAAVEPLRVGEKLEYEVSWSNFLVAGELILETKARKAVDDVDAYHVSATAQSVGLVSLTILKVKEVYDSFINASTLQPLRATRQSRRGNKRAQETIELDQQGGKATLADGRALQIPEGTYDLASLLYAIRAMDFAAGKARNFTLIEDGKLYDLSVTVEGREKLTTRTGDYQVVRLATKAAGSRSNKDPYKLKIYVTDDARRLPVLITATPSWGEVRVDLISATGGQK